MKLKLTENPFGAAGARGLIMGVICLWVFCARADCLAETNDVSEALRRLKSIHSVTDSSGYLRIIGTNAAENASVLMWAEDLLDRFDKFTDFTPDSDRNEVRVLLDPGRDADTESSVEDGRISITRYIEGRKTCFNVAVFDAGNIDTEDLIEAFTRVFFFGVLSDLAGDSGNVNVPAVRNIEQFEKLVPGWISVGTAQNLFQPLRARNNDIVLLKWTSGQMGTLKSYFGWEELSSAELPQDEYRALSCLVTAWLWESTDKSVIESIAKKAVEGKNVTLRWLTEDLLSCDTVTGAEALWDRWILSRRRVVTMPGATTIMGVEELRRMLVVRASDAFVPSSWAVGSAENLDVLIKERKEEWVKAFARDRRLRLIMLSAGKWKDYRVTVAAFCDFLEAVAEGRGESDLENLLVIAMENLKALEESVRVEEE